MDSHKVESDLCSCISAEDIAEAVKLNIGPQARVQSWFVTRAPSQGFTSLILRVNVVVLDEGVEVKHSWIAKVEPQVTAQLAKVRDDALLVREGRYFEVAVPLLRERCTELPVVKCLLARPKLILLEDLSYHVVLKSLHYPHTLLIIQNLAILHASSLDIDWRNILPHINTDCVFESKGQAFANTFQKSCSAYMQIISEFYPQLDTKYSSWLLSEKSFETLFKFMKTNLNDTNVLTHGDCWLNNILVRYNSDFITDVKFVDFPACRYVPPSRDIQYLLYTCTTRRFRDTHEVELLHAYVTSFNSFLGYERLKLDQFLQEYNASRLYGVCMALVFRTLSLMRELYPSEGEAMSDMKFAELSTKGWDGILERCQNDFEFKSQVLEILNEFICVADIFGL